MHQEFNRIQRKSLFIFKGQLNILRNPHNLQNKDATASTVNGCSTPQQFYGNQVKSVFLKKDRFRSGNTRIHAKSKPNHLDSSIVVSSADPLLEMHIP